MDRKTDPFRRRRRSIRLKDWDYSTPAVYFVTICTYHRQHLFEDPHFNEIVENAWCSIPNQPHAKHVYLDEWIVMPNHLHGIIVLTEPEEAEAQHSLDDEPKNAPLPTIMGNFKSLVTRRINNIRHSRGGKVWQRSYYERIVRNERELNAIRRYIRANPARWAEDRDNLDTLVAKMNQVDP